MRFNKRVKIGKGLNMNLSRSGAGMSIGGSGFSMSYGKKGLYLNTGIPGTGISHRQKVGGRKSGVSNESSYSHKVDATISIEVKLDDNNKPQILWHMDKKLANGVIARKGEIIRNQEILQQILKSPTYKDLLKEATKLKAEEINLKTSILTDIFKKSPKIISIAELNDELKKLNSPEYLTNLEELKKPDIEESRKELQLLANKKFNSILFWTNKKKRKNFVESNLDKHFKQRIYVWEDNLKQAEKGLNELIDKINLSLIGEPNYISKTLEDFLKETELPIDFYVDYEYSKAGKEFKVDLDLPEIEDLPTQKAVLTATSKLSIRNKTQTQIKEEYVRCVLGLGFYLTSNIFNLSPIIETVCISGYTQRVSKKTGNIEDQYVYTINFDRSQISKLNLEMIDPIEAIKIFEHQIDITKTYQLKEINPIM